MSTTQMTTRSKIDPSSAGHAFQSSFPTALATKCDTCGVKYEAHAGGPNDTFVPHKVCRQCQVDKPLDEFGNVAKRDDGKDYICKSCSALRRQAQKQAVGYLTAALRAPVPGPGESPLANVKSKPLTTPATDYMPNREVVATFAAIQMMANAGQVAPNMLFLGPSGSGKTEAARDLARRSGLPFFKIDAPAMTDPEAWFGTREVVVEDGAPKTVVNDSEFVIALGQRCILLIDEGNRVSDAIRNILLALLDDSRAVTNPLSGRVVTRHPECYVIITGNAGLAFTGTYAIDPAFYTRAVTTRFDYLNTKDETQVARSRTGCDLATAELFVRFADETRQRAKLSEDFPPISTREVLVACGLVAKGLDANTAAHQVMINAAPADGGAESIQGQLDLIWTGIRKRVANEAPSTVAPEDDDDDDQ